MKAGIVVGVGGVMCGSKGIVPSYLTELMLMKFTDAGVAPVGRELSTPLKWYVGLLLCLPYLIDFV